jgi:hypothetical protein
LSLHKTAVNFSTNGFTSGLYWWWNTTVSHVYTTVNRPGSVRHGCDEAMQCWDQTSTYTICRTYDKNYKKTQLYIWQHSSLCDRTMWTAVQKTFIGMLRRKESCMEGKVPSSRN